MCLGMGVRYAYSSSLRPGGSLLQEEIQTYAGPEISVQLVAIRADALEAGGCVHTGCAWAAGVQCLTPAFIHIWNKDTTRYSHSPEWYVSQVPFTNTQISGPVQGGGGVFSGFPCCFGEEIWEDLSCWLRLMGFDHETQGCHLRQNKES